MCVMRILQNPSYKKMLIAVIIAGTSICLASGINSNEIMAVIKNRDQVVEAEINYTAKFIMLNQAVSSDPEQGDVFLECDATWKKHNISMKILYNYLQKPVYTSLDSGVYKRLDYDKNNRLILWRPTEKYILSTPEKTEILDKHQLIYVSPDGNLETSSDLHTTKHVFPAGGTHDGTYEFKHFLLAAGLGFSDYIDPNSISEINTLNNDIMLNSRGNFGKDVKGTWKLIVDPNSNFIVRNASFTNEKISTPSVEVATFNVMIKDGLRYARQGKLRFSGIIEKNYEDIDISIKDNPELRREVKQKMEAVLLPGAEIINFSSEKPIRTTIKDGG